MPKFKKGDVLKNNYSGEVIVVFSVEDKIYRWRDITDDANWGCRNHNELEYHCKKATSLEEIKKKVQDMLII